MSSQCTMSFQIRDSSGISGWRRSLRPCSGEVSNSGWFLFSEGRDLWVSEESRGNALKYLTNLGSNSSNFVTLRPSRFVLFLIIVVHTTMCPFSTVRGVSLIGNYREVVRVLFLGVRNYTPCSGMCQTRVGWRGWWYGTWRYEVRSVGDVKFCVLEMLTTRETDVERQETWGWRLRTLSLQWVPFRRVKGSGLLRE